MESGWKPHLVGQSLLVNSWSFKWGTATSQSQLPVSFQAGRGFRVIWLDRLEFAGW